MPSIKTKNFSTTVGKFKTTIEGLRAAKKHRFVLIIMSNTHDPILKISGAKDAIEVKKTFAEICAYTGYHFCSIEITGVNYNYKNLFKTLDSVGLYNDVTVFYFSGHGFRYQNDSRYKYPQLDMRSHDNQPDFNKINFIEENTENLKVLLQIMRLYGGRINIAIADCCNTVIKFPRKKESATEIDIANDVMVAASKTFTKQLYADHSNQVCVLVSSSTHGQPALADNEIGSIFTHHFTKIIQSLLVKKSNPSQYFPWVKVLKTTAEKAFKESNKYNIGNGVAGKQKAVFEVYIESDDNYEKRMSKQGL